jgi:hypothetical protein
MTSEIAGGGAGNRNAALGAVDWLCLAAAPTFAIMALLRVFLVAARRICSARPGTMRRH